VKAPHALVTSLLLTAVLFASGTARAHIELLSPKPRYSDLKEGPCGRGALDERTTNVTTFKAGEKITVTWKETVGHPGHYRIAFDANGTGAFKDPASFTDVAGGPAVLMDGISDKSGTQTYSQEVTLPDVACDACTLQVIQVMTDKAPYGDGNDLYYQCADVALTKDDASPDAGSPPVASPVVTPPAESGGCSTSATPTSAAPMASLTLVLTAGVVLLRRARRKRQA